MKNISGGPIDNKLKPGTKLIFLLVMALFSFGCAGTTPSPGSEALVHAPKGIGKKGEGGGDPSRENHYRLGLAHLDEGDLEEARVVLESVGAEMPERIEVRNALGVLYRRLGEPERAVSEYQAALDLIRKTPGEGLNTVFSSHVQNNLGIALRETGKFREAEKAYRRAIEKNAGFADPYYNLGVLYDLYMDRPAEALKYYQKFLSLTGKHKEVELWVKDLKQRVKQPGKGKTR